MNILVIVRAVLDPNTNLQIEPSKQNIINNKYVINSYDDRAVEAAVKIKQSLTNPVKIYAIALGKEADNILRTSLARGADEAIKIDTNESNDDLIVAQTISKAILKKSLPEPDMIIVGLQSVDINTDFLAPMLATLLGYSFFVGVNSIIANDQNLSVMTNTHGKYTDIQKSVISVDHTINNPSFLKLPNIMAAKKKQIPIITAETESQHSIANNIKLQTLEPANNKRECKMINYSELLTLLQDIKQELVS